MSHELKLLIVDDAQFIRDLVKKAIRANLTSIEVFEAGDGKKAQSMLKTHRFDIVLCDWEMPIMSGLELLQWLREQPKFEKLPFIMVTSRGDKSHVVEAVEAGVNDYIGKPFNNDQLLQKVTKAIYRAYKIKPAELQSGRKISEPSESSAQTLTAAFGSSKVESGPLIAKAKGGKPLGICLLRLPSGDVIQSALKIVGLDELVLAIKVTNDVTFPTILDQAVVDFAQPDNDKDVARLNGFICLIQTAEKKQETSFINVVVKLVDQDPDKEAWLTRFIGLHQ